MASAVASIAGALIPTIIEAIPSVVNLFSGLFGNDGYDVSVKDRTNSLSNPFFVGMPNPFSFNGLFFINLICR